MNVGYSNTNCRIDLVCPICGGNVYVNKYGADYHCVNVDCFLNKKASVAIDEIKNVLVNSKKPSTMK